MMLSYHVCLHARPADARTGLVKTLAGLELPTLEVIPAELPPLGVSFEEATEALQALPRMYCEPDGSFVWVSSADDAPWQVDGNLYDRAGRLLFVDLKGSSPPSEFERLLTACGWPATEVIFQLVREAIYLAEPEFRRYALSPHRGSTT